MSKWIKKELFDKFKTKIQEEAERKSVFSDVNKWNTPDKGTVDKPKEYTIRLLPDTAGNFYRRMFYHMFQTGEKWNFSICPKTFDLDAYCPICAVTNKLYKGSEADKNEAQRFKRKEKFISNILVVDDHRDKDKDDDKKVNGKVLLYEFPSKVEALIRSSTNDSKNGVGIYGFDPGPEGFNFILKVGCTKKDGLGKEWPDYSTSTFSRNPSPIADTDPEIDSIMEKTINLTEYLEKQLSPQEKIIDILKNELVFELIEEDYNKLMRVSKLTKSEKLSTEKTSSEKSSDDYSEKDSDSINEENSNLADEDSTSSNVDDDLLAELRNL